MWSKTYVIIWSRESLSLPSIQKKNLRWICFNAIIFYTWVVGIRVRCARATCNGPTLQPHYFNASHTTPNFGGLTGYLTWVYQPAYRHHRGREGEESSSPLRARGHITYAICAHALMVSLVFFKRNCHGKDWNGIRTLQYKSVGHRGRRSAVFLSLQ